MRRAVKNGIAFPVAHDPRLHEDADGQTAGVGKGKGGKVISFLFLFFSIFRPCPGIKETHAVLSCRCGGDGQGMFCRNGQRMLLFIINGVDVRPKADDRRDNGSYRIQGASCCGRGFRDACGVCIGRIKNPPAVGIAVAAGDRGELPGRILRPYALRVLLPV